MRMPKIAFRLSVDDTIRHLDEGVNRDSVSQVLLEAVGNAGDFHQDSSKYKLSDYWSKLDVVTQFTILAAFAKERLL